MMLALRFFLARTTCDKRLRRRIEAAIAQSLYAAPGMVGTFQDSPQAKGRIERAWRTFQDRLVSELRLARATTLQQANAVLDRFCADYNQRFARPATDAACDFRPLPRRFDLARCLSLHQRVVAADHTVTLGAHSIALPPLPGHRGYAGETVELSHELDGTLRLYLGDVLLLTQPLPLEEFSDRRPAPRTTAQKPKPTMPRIYNLSGRPALAAVTQTIRG
jgi:hypothetical protein